MEELEDGGFREMVKFALIAMRDVESESVRLAWQIISDELSALEPSLDHEIILDKERPFVAGEILRCCDEREIDVVVTLGGTSLGRDDIVPEATKDVCTRDLLGFEMYCRVNCDSTDQIISRHVAMQRGDTLVINLPREREAMEACLKKACSILPAAIKSVHS